MHGVFPYVRLSYGEDGGELGRAGAAVAVLVLVSLALFAGVALAMQPPTVHLSAGIHEGPLILDHAQNLVGEPGAVVRGGIVVTADNVTIRNVTVIGGENGIEVDDAHNVTLDRVRISGVKLDGIHVRRSSVAIRNCLIHSPAGEYAQGIDISFGFDLARASSRTAPSSEAARGSSRTSRMRTSRTTASVGTTLRGSDPDRDVHGHGRGQRGHRLARRRHLLRRLFRVRDR
jgi:hypothetical protein